MYIGSSFPCSSHRLTHLELARHFGSYFEKLVYSPALAWNKQCKSYVAFLHTSRGQASLSHPPNRQRISATRGNIHSFFLAFFVLVDTYCNPHPFLQYAACNWNYHLERSNPADNETLVSSAIRLCDVNSKTWKTWFAVYIRNWNRSSPIPNFKGSLDFASWFGFDLGIERLLSMNEYSADEKLRAIGVTSLRHDQGQCWKTFKLFCDQDFPKRSRALRLRDIDGVLKQVHHEFRDVSPGVREWIDIQVQLLSWHREHLAEQIELAAEARASH